jgi:hypothetical protein
VLSSCVFPALVLRAVIELALCLLGLAWIRRKHRVGLVTIMTQAPTQSGDPNMMVFLGWWGWALCQPIGQGLNLALLGLALVMLAREREDDLPWEEPG